MSATEERMKKVYEESSPDELMLSFDREALWGEIAQELKKTPAKRISLRWLAYAAAALAGILLLVLLQPARKETLTALRKPAEKITPVTAPGPTDTAQAIVVINKAPLNKPALKVRSKHPVVQAPLAATEQVIEDASPLVPSAPLAHLAPGVLQVMVKQRKMEVRHMLDIHNEDHSIIAETTLPAEQKAKLIQLNKPGGTGEEQPAVALRRLFGNE